MATCNTDAPVVTKSCSSSDSAAPAAHERRRVLVIDDEPVVLHVLCRLLEKRHDVTAIGSVAELEKLLDGEPHFDAILCDFGLTTADGTEVSAMLLRRWPERAPQLAVLTGNALSERVIGFARSEVVRLIAKPISATALFALVEELAGAWSPRSDAPFEYKINDD